MYQIRDENLISDHFYEESDYQTEYYTNPPVYFHDNDALEVVELPSLTDVGQYLYFHGNDVLSSLELTSSLTSVGEYVSIYGSPMLCVPSLDWSGISDSVDISGVAECDALMATPAAPGHVGYGPPSTEDGPHHEAH